LLGKDHGVRRCASVSDDKLAAKDALRKTLLEVIELWLPLKFGEESRVLMSQIMRIDDPEELQKLKDFIVKARKLSEVEEFIKGLV